MSFLKLPALLWAFLFTAALAEAAPVTLRQVPAPFPGLGGATFAWGDYDNDGFLDLVIAGQVLTAGGQSMGTQLYHNNRNGTFTAVPDIRLRGYRSADIAWGDFDNDGFLDLAITGISDTGGLCTIYRNLGGTNLVEFKTVPGTVDGQLAWGDFDNDGRLDLAITGAGSFRGYTQVYRNVNGTDFVLAGPILAQTYYGTIGWADFNGDGFMDLLVTGIENTAPPYGATAYQSDGAGHFTPTWFFPFADLIARWIDWDNDGSPDIAAGKWSDQSTHLFHNNGAGLFEDGPTLPIGQTTIVADLNADGWSDLLLDNRVFENSGTGQWTEAKTILPPHVSLGAKPPAAVADYDNDGLLDVVVGGDDAAGNFYSRLYHNETAATNLPPAAPTAPGSVASRTAVRLFWAAATDDHQLGGLSYNVRVGSFPGGGDIVNPMAAADGRRRLPAAGNASENLFLRLTGLQAGRTYYWSVQAIDNGYLGSPFAAEQSFLAADPPELSGFSDLILPEDTESKAIPFVISDPDFSADDLTVTVTSSNPHLLPDSRLQLSGTGANRTLTVFPSPGEIGGASISVQLRAPDGGTVSAEFQLTVIPVNHPPLFTPGPDQSTGENVGPSLVTGWATSISAGPAYEWLQTVHFEVTNDNPSLFSTQPSISPDGTLTYESATNAWGEARVTVTLHDDGGIAGGGSDVSAPQTFHVTIVPIYRPPVPYISASGLATLADRADHYAITDCAGVARLLFDASGTTNPLQRALTYSWRLDGVAADDGTILKATFMPGTHTITLDVQDGVTTSETTLQLRVLSAPSGIRLLADYLTANAGPHDVGPLREQLAQAAGAYDLGDCAEMIRTLQGFQAGVAALFTAADPVAQVSTASAQAIMDATAGRSFASSGNLTLIFVPALADNAGSVRLRFPGTSDAAPGVEVSADLSHWSALGKASRQADGFYEFDDPDAGAADHRFYRVSTAP